MSRQYTSIIIVAVLLIIPSCSSPKYTYNFDHYDYTSGRKTQRGNTPGNSTPEINNPLLIGGNEMIASAGTDRRHVDPKTGPTELSKETTSLGNALSGAERKELKRGLKNYIKSQTKQIRSGEEPARVNATKQLDDDLKLSIIFGAIGITFAILGGINTLFWVTGVIGLIIGLVFFIRWISTQ